MPLNQSHHVHTTILNRLNNVQPQSAKVMPKIYPAEPHQSTITNNQAIDT